MSGIGDTTSTKSIIYLFKAFLQEKDKLISWCYLEDV